MVKTVDYAHSYLEERGFWWEWTSSDPSDSEPEGQLFHHTLEYLVSWFCSNPKHGPRLNIDCYCCLVHITSLWDWLQMLAWTSKEQRIDCSGQWAHLGRGDFFLISCIFQKCKSSGTVAPGIPKKLSDSHRENLLPEYCAICNSHPGI